MTKINSEAIFLVKKGGAEESFERRNLSIDRPEGDDVLIETEAFGLNYADVMARRGIYREAPPMPCVVGYEVVGRIVEVGDNVPKEAIGSRVVAFCRFGGYAKHVVTQYRATAVINELPAQEAMARHYPGLVRPRREADIGFRAGGRIATREIEEEHGAVAVDADHVVRRPCTPGHRDRLAEA
jgi:hypothetical protein